MRNLSHCAAFLDGEDIAEILSANTFATTTVCSQVFEQFNSLPSGVACFLFKTMLEARQVSQIFGITHRMRYVHAHKAALPERVCMRSRVDIKQKKELAMLEKTR